MSVPGQDGPIPVVGIRPDNPDQPPCRLELRQMHANYLAQWNLFLLGMERFMDPSREDDALSFYQIAGIHGLPYQTWPENSSSWNPETPLNPDTGYCTHSSVLFLSWHRPFMALYEQALYQHVNEIAQEYGADEQRDVYTKAAQTFRIPYWDWAMKTSGDITLYPVECWSSTQHQVIRPGSKGKATPISPNPLAGYRFGAKAQSVDGIDLFPKVDATLRHPLPGGDQSTKSNENAVQTELAEFSQGAGQGQQYGKGKNLTERVLWILTAYENYGAMCCNLFQDQEPDWTGWGSVEDVHNSIHVYVGGDGHMGSIETSAFDPIFWLHHNNIDRLFAIWQALHDDWITPSDESQPTRMYPAGASQDKNSLLAPFNASEKIGDYWTSDTARNTKTFGYVYPETQDWVYKSRQAIKDELKRLYSSGSFAGLASQPDADIRQPLAELTARARLHKAVAANSANDQVLLKTSSTGPQKVIASIGDDAIDTDIPADRSIKDLVRDGTYLEWLVNLKAEKHTKDGDFVVHVFLGAPNDADPAVYVFNSNHVASFSTLGQRQNTGCAKCKKDQGGKMQVTGQIPLTLALVERYLAGQVDGLDVESVEPYLSRELHWRVTNKAGQRIPREGIEGLLVGVVTCEVTLPTDSAGAPRYAATVVPRPNVTTRADGRGGRGKGTGYTGGPIS